MAVNQNDIEMLQTAIKITLSESAVANIAVILKSMQLFNVHVDREVAWFANQLIAMLSEDADMVADNADKDYCEYLLSRLDEDVDSAIDEAATQLGL